MGAGIRTVPQRRECRFAGQRVEGELGDEAQRVIGEDGRNTGPEVDQATTDLDGLVCGDAAADRQDDPDTPELAR